jgi:energy-coupling factor transporter transmembrane protein EcfT
VALLEKSDWFTLIVTGLALGIGLYMSTYHKTLIRGSGIALILVSAGALAFWFGYYRNGTADAQGGINLCNNSPGSTNSNSCNNNTIISPPHEKDSFYQGDKKVGHANPPTVTPDGKATFNSGAAFTAFLDPKVPLEYGDNLILQCPDAPMAPNPHMNAAQIGIAMTQLDCIVVGRK